ncbi:hypothetical protein BDB01DRAFT_725664 [Pilobolus umbonatus]|nr:hypothetical protein BDB01DRAFT_725664 [Pilobolus umbonatus]
MTITITVPEAAAAPDTIQFKLVLSGDISWIHNRLRISNPTIVIPSLPETPTLNLIDDQDYVERKRMQIERFFLKIATRPELLECPDFSHFLSSDMSPNEVGPSNTGVLSFLRFNRVIKPSTERGFKSFKASEIIEGNDQDTFHKHQIYILLQESYYGTIVESLDHLIQIREDMGDTLANMGDLLIETTQSKYRMGIGLAVDAKESQRMLDKKMQMFGLLLDELGFISTRQGKEETIRFGDVINEYKNSMDPLKVVFNTRTVKLMDYVDRLKYRNRKRDKSDKLKLKLGINHPMVTDVMQEEKEVSL